MNWTARYFVTFGYCYEYTVVCQSVTLSWAFCWNEQKWLVNLHRPVWLVASAVRFSDFTVSNYWITRNAVNFFTTLTLDSVLTVFVTNWDLFLISLRTLKGSRSYVCPGGNFVVSRHFIDDATNLCGRFIVFLEKEWFYKTVL